MAGVQCQIFRNILAGKGWVGLRLSDTWRLGFLCREHVGVDAPRFLPASFRLSSGFVLVLTVTEKNVGPALEKGQGRPYY